MDTQELFVPWSGGVTWCRVRGVPSNGHAVVVVHGGPGYPSYYLENVEHLARSDRVVITYDQMCCGRSDGPQDPHEWTVENLVEQLLSLFAHFRLATVDLIGHSFGVFLALEVATRAPELLRRLVLASGCAASSSFVQSAQQRAKGLPADLYTVVEESLVTNEFDNPRYREAKQRFLADYCDRVHPLPWGLTMADRHMNVAMYEHMWGPSEFHCTGTLRDWDVRAQLPRVTSPVLLTSGEYDEAGPFAQQEMLDLLPDARWKVFPNSAHHAHITDEVAWLDAVDSFLNE